MFIFACVFREGVWPVQDGGRGYHRWAAVSGGGSGASGGCRHL